MFQNCESKVFFKITITKTSETSLTMESIVFVFLRLPSSCAS